MLHRNLEAIAELTRGVAHLTVATTDLVNVTRALHRERAVQLRQEFERAKGEDDIRYKNFDMFFLHERLKALEISTGGEIVGFDEAEMPSLAEPNGRGEQY